MCHALINWNKGIVKRIVRKKDYYFHFYSIVVTRNRRKSIIVTADELIRLISAVNHPNARFPLFQRSRYESRYALFEKPSGFFKLNSISPHAVYTWQQRPWTIVAGPRGERKRERERKERKRKRTKIGGDLYRTDYSTLNRVFGWNIGIRGRKPTQSDTQGERGTPAWAERGSPHVLLLDICFLLSLSLSIHLMLSAHKETSLRYRLEKIVSKLSSLPFQPYIHERCSSPFSLPANEFRNFPLVNEFLIFSLKSMSTDPLDPPNQTIQTILDITNIFFNRAAPPSSSSSPPSFRLITKFLPPHLPPLFIHFWKKFPFSFFLAFISPSSPMILSFQYRSLNI